MVSAIEWRTTHLELIDQRHLPFKKGYFRCDSAEDAAFAIKAMVVRGAPAIGVTAAYGLVLALRQEATNTSFKRAIETLAASRPTAVNLFDALEYMATALGDIEKLAKPIEKAEKLAMTYHQDDLAKNKQIGTFGANLLQGQRQILTHCNTGSLATSGWGTALGVIRQIHLEGRLKTVYANETRPFLQGARLTVWECRQDGLPVKLITDGMGGYLMAEGQIDAIIVGSDRITANGDVANKIGTFMLAMAAKHHNLPFIVAAPSTTIDTKTKSGAEVPIEQREPIEVTHVRNQWITQKGTEVCNPAFDITPASLVTAIITENGIFHYPYNFGSK